MALGQGITCDAELLETLRLALSKITPRELEDYARSTPSFLTGGFRATKPQLLRARIMSMLASAEPVDARLRAMLRDQVRRSLEAGGGAAAVQRELEGARASIAALKGADARLAKESQARAQLEAKVAALEGKAAALERERGALRQRLERAEAEARSLAADMESRCEAAVQARLACEFAKIIGGDATAATSGASDGGLDAGRIVAAIESSRDSEVAAWRLCADMLSGAGALDADARGAVAIALRRRLAAIHARGLGDDDPDKDADPDSARTIFRRALSGRIPAILLIDAHNSLFALQGRYRLKSEHHWPTAQARDWFVRDVCNLLSGMPNLRAYIVFDGPERSDRTASANVVVIYSGGTGEHRADGVLVDQAKFLQSAGAENMIIFTNDGELAGLASRHGAKNLAPTVLGDLM